MSNLLTLVSANNSTTGTLGAYGTFTGSIDDLRSFQEVDLNVGGSPANASGTLTFEFSPDGTHWDVSVPVLVAALPQPPITLRVVLPYFRVKYGNGGNALTELRITTLLHRGSSKQLSRFLNQPLNNSEPIEVVRSVIAAQTGPGAFQNVYMSGSGLLVSADPAYPLWVTGTVHMADVSAVTGTVALARAVDVASMPVVTVTGSVGLAQAVAVSNLPAVQTVTGTMALARAVDVATLPPIAITSGSVTGLLYGGVAAGQSNPLWVTGTVHVENPGGGGSGGNVTSLSGSVTGLLVGGQALAGSNPLPVTGTVHLADSSAVVVSNTVTVTGSVGLTAGVVVQNVVSVTGTVSLASVSAVTGAVVLAAAPGVTVLSGSVSGLLYGGVPASSLNPFWVTGSVGVTNAPSSVTVLSGSVSGLLVGGQPASQVNPVPTSQQGTVTVTGSLSLSQAVAVSNVVSVTGTVHMADVSAVTGTVVLGRAVDVATLPSVTVGNTVTVTGSVGLTMGPNVTALSGSVTGLLVGGVAVSQANPIPVQTIGAGANVTTVSGSVTGLLLGGVAVAGSNPVPVTGTVHLADVSTITGSVVMARAVDVATLPAVTQGTAAGLGAPWPVILVSGSDVIGQKTDPLWVTGSVFVINQSAGGPASNVTVVSGSVTGLLVGGNALAGSNPLPVTGTVSLASVSAVTGSVTLAAVAAVNVSNTPAVTLASTVISSGSVTGLLVGGNALAGGNPLPVTGTVSLASVSTITGSVTLAASPNVFVLSGSVAGLLVGGVAASQANPLPVVNMSGSAGVLVGGQNVSRSNLVPVAKYDSYGAAELSGTFYTQGFKNTNSATSGSTTVASTTNVGNRVTVTSAIISVGINFPNTTFWLASTSSAGLSNLTGYFWAGGTTQDTGRLVVLPYNQNGWFQTGLCQANSTASLLLQSNTSASIGVTVTYFVTP